MSARTCLHERDVLDLVAIDQWPQRADASLRAHVAGCAVCAEVASIASAVREWNVARESNEDAPVARMPEASVVWHRAQLKAKADAARAASRPVWVAQGFALVALIVALVWFGPGSSWYASTWTSVSSAVPSVSLGTAALPAGWGWSVGLGLSGVVLLFFVIIGALRISERSEIPNR